MMKRSMRIACVVCAVLFLIVPLAHGAKKKKRLDDVPQIRKWWERPKIVKQLDLAEDQKSRVKEIYNERYNQIVEDRWNYRQQKSQLEDLLRKTDLDEDRIKTQTEQVQAARAALEKTLTEMQTAMMRELSPAQRDKLLTILKKWKEEKPRKAKKKEGKLKKSWPGR
jgi:Spy/CpxP family protein refolding chaperone